MDSIRNSWNKTLDVTFEWLPRLVGALVILIIGWIVASVLRGIVERGLRKVRLDEMLHSGQGGNYIQRAIPNPSRLIALLVYWIILLGAVTLSAGALGSSMLNNAIAAVYGYIPHIIAALIIFIVAGALSAGVVALIKDTMPDSPTAAFLSTMAPLVIMAVGIFMILDQLGIARDIVVITYAAIMGSIGLSTALAFGFGGRDMAARLLDDTYKRSQSARGPVRSAAQNAKTKAQNMSNKNSR